MKKTFLAKRNAIFSSENISWGTFALAISIFFLLLRLLTPNFFWQIFTPMFRLSETVSEKSQEIFNSFKDTAEIASQNEKLIDENIVLANENRALLQKIKNISGFAPDARGIIAGVIARPPESPYDTLVLAKGSNDGIELGMEAFGVPMQTDAGVVPLGIVSMVLSDFSRITLFSAPKMIVNGWVGRENLPFQISGTGAGTMNASVPRSAGIEVGDIVFVPGPGMLPIGSVIRIDSDPSSSSATLRIIPLLNPFSIAWVELRNTGAVATSTMP